MKSWVVHLQKLFGSCSMRDEENEHSLEIELPFVYHLFGSRAKVVLMMVGAVSSSYKSKIAPFLSLFFIFYTIES